MGSRGVRATGACPSAPARPGQACGLDSGDRRGDFLVWTVEGNYSLSGVTSSTFGLDLKRLITELEQADPAQAQQDVLTKTRKDHGFEYRECWSKLQQHLERTSSFVTSRLSPPRVSIKPTFNQVINGVGLAF